MASLNIYLSTISAVSSPRQDQKLSTSTRQLSPRPRSSLVRAESTQSVCVEEIFHDHKYLVTYKHQYLCYIAAQQVKYHSFSLNKKMFFVISSLLLLSFSDIPDFIEKPAGVSRCGSNLTQEPNPNLVARPLSQALYWRMDSGFLSEVLGLVT